jgi:hypothetical protein
MRAWLALVAGFVAVSALLVSSDASAVPSFGRQTGFACEACHTAFPELTPFGRRFKLNGYVLDNMQQVKTITAQNEEALLLNYIPPLSLMFQASYTRTKAALPDVTLPDGLAQNNQVLFHSRRACFTRDASLPTLVVSFKSPTTPPAARSGSTTPICVMRTI